MGQFISKRDKAASSLSPSLPTKRVRLAGVLVTLSEPEHPSGLTFLIPGSMLSESSYISTRQVLHHEQNQVVISFYVNVFSKSHDSFADDVARIYEAYCQKAGSKKFSRREYSIVGHSVGGKIALLCATDPITSQSDSESHHQQNYHRIGTVLALDPVDDHPPEFTCEDPNDNPSRSLQKHHATTVVLTHAQATPTWAVPVKRNAVALAATAPNHVRLVSHENASHMAYTDNNGGFTGWMMRGNSTPQGNEAAREDAHALIRKYIR